MRRRVFTAVRILIGVAVSAGLGWLAVRGLVWEEVADAFSRVSPPLVVLALAVFVGATYLRAARWRVLFVNGEVSTNRLFVIQNIGIGLNNVVPVRVASEAAQLAILSLRDGVRASVSLATLGMERTLDVVASGLIFAVALFLVPEMERFSAYAWAAVGLAALCAALALLLAWSGSGARWTRRLPFLAAFAAAVSEMIRHRTRMAAAMAMSVLYWLLVGVTAWILASSMSLPISPTTATLVIMGTIFFATAVPAAPAAIGAFEFAMVYVLDAFGVERAQAFGFAVITHAAFFLPPTLMAAALLPREGLGSFVKIRRLVAERAREAA